MNRIGLPDVVPRIEVVNTTVALTDRFKIIMEPFGPLTFESFGDPEQEDQVLAALHSDLGSLLPSLPT